MVDGDGPQEEHPGEPRTGDAPEPVPEAADLPLPQIAPSALRAATGGGLARDDAPLDESEDDPEVDGEPRGETATDAVPAEEQPTAPAEPLDADEQAWRELPLTTRLEALLFAATGPLSLRRLQNLAGDVDAADVRDGLASLDAHYEASSRSFGLEEIGGGFQLRTRPELSGLLARLGRKRSTEKLTPAALETLAIVAYRQPVLRVDVEKIRGVASGEVLRTLVEKGMVRVAGRADLPGAPLLYGTTPAFLELFGLRDLRDLPSDRELLRAP